MAIDSFYQADPEGKLRTMIWKTKTFDELTTRELYEILKSRAEIFVKEQGINYVDDACDIIRTNWWEPSKIKRLALI